MRKVDDGKKGKEERMSFLVATNVVASRPPKCRPTGTPHARAKSKTWGVGDSLFWLQPPTYMKFHRCELRGYEIYLFNNTDGITSGN